MRNTHNPKHCPRCGSSQARRRRNNNDYKCMSCGNHYKVARQPVRKRNTQLKHSLV